MHDVAFYVAIVWTGVLIGSVLAVLVRTKNPLDRILAIDTMVLFVVAALLVLAAGRETRLYVDAALALALLSFSTTVALTYLQRRKAG